MCNTHRIVDFLMEPNAFLMSLLNRGKIKFKLFNTIIQVYFSISWVREQRKYIINYVLIKRYEFYFAGA